MNLETFLDGRVTLHKGDCLDVLRGLPDCSVDSVVTDPPYGLVFMGKAWDTGDRAFAVDFWQEVWRVLKPGGHVAAFSGTRTYHRLAVAIEDAGFEIRDQLAWTYGSGFPKSHDVSKAIDKAAGAKRIKTRDGVVVTGGYGDDWATNSSSDRPRYDSPATPEAEQWQGWGTTLKPAWEPICLARKPFIGTVAENVLTHGTGAINVDGCRVGTEETITNHSRSADAAISKGKFGDSAAQVTHQTAGQALGRFPANLLHDGSEEVVALFPDNSGGASVAHKGSASGDIWSNSTGKPAGDTYADSGSAARFFYTAKADANDRLGSKHPTVKPLDLMQWLVRLITPPGGTTLDPFAGTGTTGEAAWREGFSATLIERETEYQADIATRMQHALAGPDERKTAIVKRKGLEADAGPLFGRTEQLRSGGAG